MNKQELESKSDFEINELTAMRLGLNVSKEQWMHLGDRDENLVIIDTSKDSSSIVNRTFDTVDYCNSWADMGPIMQSKRISFEPSISDDSWFSADTPLIFSAKHKNPLRAAAIVYLLMQGDE